LSHRAAARAALVLLLAPLLARAAADPGAGHGHRHAPPPEAPSAYAAAPALAAARASLPPPPDGVRDLAAAELFAPSGRRGLEYSARARALDGQRVRMLGYMVRQDLPADGLLLLAPYPFQLHETEYGLAEDLPASTVHVVVPDRAGEPVPHTPGLLLLTGRLELGPREEADGRVSTVRLVLDPSPAQRDAGGGPPRSFPHPLSNEENPR
jgi:hypothetical protein